MKNKFLIFNIFFLLTVTVINAQTDNFYKNFSVITLKEDSIFKQNFNAGIFNDQIVYSCMSQIIDSARMRYVSSKPLNHNFNLDSTAQFQANYQAFKNIKTDENEIPYKRFSDRLKKYGFTSKGVELLTKAKAFNAEADYSYYDLCLNEVLFLLSNAKTAELLLNKEFTNIGIGFAVDKNLRTVYMSLVLGSDRIFVTQEKSAYPFTKVEHNYKTGKSGLKPYDDAICKKCITDPALEVLSSYIKIDNTKIFFQSPDLKLLKTIIGKDGDAFVIDFVQYIQYDCEKIDRNNDLDHRGFVTKPINLSKLIAKNDSINPKLNKLYACIGEIPEQVNEKNPFDFNIIILKNNNTVCRTVYKKHILVNNAKSEIILDSLILENRDKIPANRLNVYQNAITQYNKTLKLITRQPLSKIADINKYQGEVDKLYLQPSLNKSNIDRLNLKFQIDIVNLMQNEKLTVENNTILNNSYSKIKILASENIHNWQEAYYVGSLFSGKNEYSFAVKLMDPYIDDPDISKDFLFAYITMAATNDNMFMSSIFSSAVKIASKKYSTEICGLFDELPLSLFDNQETKKIICSACNR